jgi:hypothetical protein
MAPSMEGGPRSGRLVMADGEPLLLSVRRSAAFSLLSFRLPKSTRPGSYAGSAEVGERKIPVVIEVEAQPRLRFLPSKISFRGGPGARLRAEITVLNLGNMDVVIEPKSSFCIFDNQGVGEAFYAALTEKEVDGRRRIDRVMDELAESHGGMVRAAVLKGSGMLEPEDHRELRVEFQLARRVRPGRSYTGAWMIAKSSLEVEVEAMNAADEVGNA